MSYIKEAEQLQQKIEKMRSDAQNDEEEYRVKKEEEVLQVSFVRFSYTIAYRNRVR